jgi:hypothetical protein
MPVNMIYHHMLQKIDIPLRYVHGYHFRKSYIKYVGILKMTNFDLPMGVFAIVHVFMT